MSNFARRRKANTATNTEAPATDEQEPSEAAATTEEAPATRTRSRASRVQSSSTQAKAPTAKKATGARFTQSAAQIRDKVDREKERNAGRREPMRFFLKKNTAEQIIILDSEVTCGVHEHTMKVGGNWQTVPCIKDYDTCPACHTGDNSSYVVMLTVLKFSEKEGKEVIYKNLLPIKPTQTEMFFRLLDQHGSLRGMVVEMKRGGDDNAPRIGSPMFVEKLSEEDIKAEFMLDAPKKTQKGEVYQEVDYFTVPFNYEEVLPMYTPEDMQNRWGFELPEGSTANARRELAEADNSDEIPF